MASQLMSLMQQRRGLAWPVNIAGAVNQHISAQALTARGAAAQGVAAAAWQGAARAVAHSDRALTTVFGHGIAAPSEKSGMVAQAGAQRAHDAWAFGLVGRAGIAATEGMAARLGSDVGRQRALAAGYGVTAVFAQLSALIGLLPRAVVLAGGALVGALRYAMQPRSKTVWEASPQERLDLQQDLLKQQDSPASPTVPGVAQLFASDANRMNLFAGDQNIRAADSDDENVAQTAQQLVAFCDNDPAWALRVSQFANQTLGNAAWWAEQNAPGQNHRHPGEGVAHTVKLNRQARPVEAQIALVKDGSQMRLEFQQHRPTRPMRLRDNPSLKPGPEQTLAHPKGYLTRVIVSVPQPSAMSQNETPVQVLHASLQTQ